MTVTVSTSLLRSPWLFSALLVVAIALMPTVALAQGDTSARGSSPAGIPTVEALDDAGNRQSSRLPWLSIKDLEWHPKNSVFWNHYFRAGTGTVNLIPYELNRYDYNNMTDRVDSGVIKEHNHTITLAGSLFPWTRAFATFGLIEAGIDFGDDNVQSYRYYSGLQFAIGGDLGIPLPIEIDGINQFTLVFRGFFRQWEGTNNNATGPQSLQAKNWAWHAIGFLNWQILGGRSKFTWDFYVGGQWAYTVQRWEVSSTTIEKITPDNSASQKNGSGRYSLIVGTNFYPWDWMSIGIEAQFIGPFRINGSINLLF